MVAFRSLLISENFVSTSERKVIGTPGEYNLGLIVLLSSNQNPVIFGYQVAPGKFCFLPIILNRAKIIGFHMTSRPPCWCPQTMKWRPCWCPDPILRELKAIIILTSSFVFVEKHGCWSCE